MSKKKISLYRLIDTSSFLQQVPLFESIPPKYLNSIAEIVEDVTLLVGETLFSEGDVGDSMYLIRSGKVSVQVKGREVNVLGKHDCIGEMAVIDGLHRSASVVIVENTTFMRIWGSDFKNLMAFQPEVSLALMRTIAFRLREAEKKAWEKKLGSN